MAWFDWLRKKAPETGPASASTQASGLQAPKAMRAQDDPAYELAFQTRQAVWQSVGTVEPEVLSYVVSPQLAGGFAWPTTRQAFVVVRAQASLIIASDGLSDPFFDQPDRDEPGFWMEVYGEFVGLQDLPMAQIIEHSAFKLVQGAADLTAEMGGLTGHLSAGVLSTEVAHDGDLGPAWISQGRIGALLAVHTPKRPKVVRGGPLGIVRLVPVTALTRTEIAHAAKSKAGRDRIVKGLRDAKLGHITDFNRETLV